MYTHTRPETLRSLLGVITAEPVQVPGRGGHRVQLRLRLSRQAWVSAILVGIDTPVDTDCTFEVILSLWKPLASDALLAAIRERRANGMKWYEIARDLGGSKGYACSLFKSAERAGR